MAFSKEENTSFCIASIIQYSMWFFYLKSVEQKNTTEEKQDEQDASGSKKKKKNKNKPKTISIDEFQHGPAQAEEKGKVLQYVFLDIYPSHRKSDMARLFYLYHSQINLI